MNDPKKNTSEVKFSIAPERPDVTDILKMIASEFVVTKTYESSERQTIVDSYDCRFLNNNLVLIKCGRIYSLINMPDDSTVSSIIWDKKQGLTCQADHFTPKLNKKLSRILGRRVIIPMLNLDVRTNIFTLESAKKQAIIFTIRQYTLADNPATRLPAMIYLQSSHYSNKQLKKMCSILPEIVTEPGGVWHPLINAALKAAGFLAIPNETAYRKIVPETTIKSAAIAVMKFQLSIMRYNEKGIIADIDSECLHDFRVALRKMRVVLSEFKEIFPENKIAHFAPKLDELGAITNRLRDCDVFLGQKEHLKKILHQRMHPALLRIFKSRQQYRRRQFLSLTSMINSKQYASMMSSLVKFINFPEKLSVTEKSKVYVLPGISCIILKRLEKIINKGIEASTNYSDVDLHKVRIQCKKLRYLLDFFHSILPRNKVSKVIKNLKKIQTALGNFNDCSVQIRSMKDQLSKLSSEKNAIDYTTALVAIIATLSKEKANSLAQFQKVFSTFNSHETITPLQAFLTNNLT